MPPLTLEGAQVRLRDWQDADLARFADWMQPGHRWQEFDGPYYAKPDAAGIEQIVVQRRAQLAAGSWPDPRHNFVIADAGSDMLIGQVGWYWESEETQWLSVGISIYDPQMWGRSLGYEALGLWSDYLFERLPLIVRLDLRTWSGNVGMMKLAEKLGYVEEARFRRARIVDGQHYDGMGYGVLREEWVARYPQGFAAGLRQKQDVV